MRSHCVWTVKKGENNMKQLLSRFYYKTCDYCFLMWFELVLLQSLANKWFPLLPAHNSKGTTVISDFY